jgi:aminoglycoside 6'-N-acetyltransferase I
MRHGLWPDGSVGEHAFEVAPLLAGELRGTLPATVLVAQAEDGGLVGFIEVGLRSHADGCDPSHAVGFVEGWYVVPAYRGRKIGAQLLTRAEEWARAAGCREMASDTWLDNIDSQRAHEALGFEVVDRCVNYRKRL